MHPTNTPDRRHFIKSFGLALTGAALLPSCFHSKAIASKPWFDISLAQWSLHKALFAKKISNLDFPAMARSVYGIETVEYVNTFFKDKAEDTAYLRELMDRCKDNGVKNHLIMCDGEGELGASSEAERKKAVENHYKWVDAAKYLGCKTIRVNAAGSGTAKEVAASAADGLSRLGEYASKENINVIVENHGSYSSNGQWLSGVMKKVNMANVGTLPDFGNFCIKRDPENYRTCIESYDRYIGAKEIIPFAKGVSAKSYDFDAQGNCIETDYFKMLTIVKESGFRGIIGIEYEGDTIGEEEGIKKTKALLEKVRMAV